MAHPAVPVDGHRRDSHPPGRHAGRHRGADGPGRLRRNRGARISRAPLHRARRIQGVRGLHGPRRERGRNGMETRISVSFEPCGPGVRLLEHALAQGRLAGGAPAAARERRDAGRDRPAGQRSRSGDRRRSTPRTGEAGAYVGSLSVEDFEVDASMAHASPTTSARTSSPRRSAAPATQVCPATSGCPAGLPFDRQSRGNSLITASVSAGMHCRVRFFSAVSAPTTAPFT